jgi:hypothetical protein
VIRSVPDCLRGSSLIALYLVCAGVGAGVYGLARKMAPLPRTALAVGVFLGLAVFATAAIEMIGDKPLPGARTIVPAESR